MVNLSPTRQQKRGVILSAAKNPRGSLQNVWHARFAAGQPEEGFTLLELMIVMVIVGLLAAIAVPMYVQSVRHAREAVLREDLRTLRSAIDSYTVDKQKAPQTLDDLVQAGYIKSMPVDPFTHRSDTWIPAQDDTLMSLDQTESGINDVHSGAPGAAADGTSYSTW